MRASRHPARRMHELPGSSDPTPAFSSQPWEPQRPRGPGAVTSPPGKGSSADNSNDAAAHNSFRALAVCLLLLCAEHLLAARIEDAVHSPGAAPSCLSFPIHNWSGCRQPSLAWPPGLGGAGQGWATVEGTMPGSSPRPVAAPGLGSQQPLGAGPSSLDGHTAGHGWPRRWEEPSLGSQPSGSRPRAQTLFWNWRPHGLSGQQCRDGTQVLTREGGCFLSTT